MRKISISETRAGIIFLKIKTFLGTTLNAVLTQIWIALIVYLLLAFLKIRS